MTIPEKLAALRAEMAERGMDAYVIPTDDFHASEYVGDYFKCREYMSGFTGSAGTLVVMKDEAALWTDGRYFLQAADQLAGSTITLMKMGEPDVPTITEYLMKKVTENGKIGFDGRTISSGFGKSLGKEAAKKGITLAGGEDLVDIVWTDRPEISKKPVWEMPDFAAGLTRAEKLAKVREKMAEKGREILLIPSLMENAWLLNLRGDDVACTPVFLSYMIITAEKAYLFAHGEIFSAAIREKLAGDGIEILPYTDVDMILEAEAAGKTAWADASAVNYRLMTILESKAKPHILREASPVDLMKAVKTEAEQQGFIDAHIQDGVAVTRFMYWIKHHVGKEKITELSACEKLLDFRKERDGFIGPSFDTIMGYGPHGAIIHYEPTLETDCEVLPKSLLLVDSGGHYKYGTTDITRTIVLGEATEEEKKAFTLVLQGHLHLANAVFRYGCAGTALDYLAREPMWKERIDYNHGTGHGVGHVLSVHEGPQSIGYQSFKKPVKLEEGMIISDEPGLYYAGKFGIRHENLVLVKKDERNEYGQFMKFTSLTKVPFDKDGLDLSILTAEDKKQLNSYHEEVWNALESYFTGEEREWLREATNPIE